MCCWDPYQVGFLSFPIVIALHFPLHSFNYLAFSPSLPFSFPFPLFLLFSSFPFLSFLLPHSSYLILSYPILSCPILINPLFTFPPIISAPAPLDSAVCVCVCVSQCDLMPAGPCGNKLASALTAVVDCWFCVHECVFVTGVSQHVSLTHHLCPVSPCGFTRWALLSWQVSGSLLQSCYSDWTFQSYLLFNFLCAVLVTARILVFSNLWMLIGH